MGDERDDDQLTEENQLLNEPETLDSETDGEYDDDDDEPIVIPKLRQAIGWFWAHRRKTVPLTAAGVLLLVLAVPYTRYRLAGVVYKRDYHIAIIDQQTGVPVSDASVQLRGMTVQTDADGIAVFQNVATGMDTLTITKNHYEPTSVPVTIGFSQSAQPRQLPLAATGRLVPINVIDKITGKGIANVTVTAADSSAITNDRGEATIVLPSPQKRFSAKFTTTGFNELTGEILVSQQVVAANTFALIPSGSVYFVDESRDLYKARLDGSQKQKVANDITDTLDGFVMRQTDDWRFIAFISRRAGSSRLLVLDTESGELKEVDGKPGSFVDFIGWSGHRLFYKLTRGEVEYWQASRYALKRYDAESGQSLIIDQNQAIGGSENDAVYEQYSPPLVVSGGLLYAKTWVKAPQAEVSADNLSDGVYYLHADDDTPEALQAYQAKEPAAKLQFELVATRPHMAIVRYSGSEGQQRLRFENGLVVNDGVSAAAFQKHYPTFLLSPGGLNSLWRNEQGQLLVGDQNGENGQLIESSETYAPLGWYGDGYVLVKSASHEFFVMPSNGIGTLGQRLKITDTAVYPR